MKTRTILQCSKCFNTFRRARHPFLFLFDHSCDKCPKCGWYRFLLGKDYFNLTTQVYAQTGCRKILGFRFKTGYWVIPSERLTNIVKRAVLGLALNNQISIDELERIDWELMVPSIKEAAICSMLKD